MQTETDETTIKQQANKQLPSVILGNLIKEQRIKQKALLGNLASEIKLPVTSLSEIEHGIGKHLNYTVLRRICDTLKPPCNKEILMFDLLKQTESQESLTWGDLYRKKDLLPAFPTETYSKLSVKEIDDMLQKRFGLLPD